MFFFLVPCQSAVPSDSRVGGPSSSHFQKVLLKIVWEVRGRLFFNKWCVLTKIHHRGKFMLKGKCLLLQTVLIFPSAKRALTPSPPCNSEDNSLDWGRTGVTGPFILAKNVKTTAVLQQTLGTFKNQRPKGRGPAAQGAHAFVCPNIRSQLLLLLWRLGQIVLLSVFLLTKSHKRHEAASAPHLLVPTAVKGLGMCVCAHVHVCTHCVGHGLSSVGPLIRDLQVTQWEWRCAWQMHPDGSSAGAKESDS